MPTQQFEITAPESGLSSVKIKTYSDGRIVPEVKIYAKTNKKKDIDTAKKWAIETFESILSHYIGT